MLTSRPNEGMTSLGETSSDLVVMKVTISKPPVASPGKPHIFSKGSGRLTVHLELSFEGLSKQILGDLVIDSSRLRSDDPHRMGVLHVVLSDTATSSVAVSHEIDESDDGKTERPRHSS